MDIKLSQEIALQPILIVSVEDSEAIQAKLKENKINFNIDKTPLTINKKVTDHVIFFKPSDKERIEELLGL